MGEPDLKPNEALKADDLNILREWRSLRALARRKGLTPRMQVFAPARMAELEDQARDHGLVLRGWREYPQRDSNGNLAFGISDRGLEPPKTRKRRKAPKSNGTLPADLMAKLEQTTLDLIIAGRRNSHD